MGTSLNGLINPVNNSHIPALARINILVNIRAMHNQSGLSSYSVLSTVGNPNPWYLSI